MRKHIRSTASNICSRTNNGIRCVNERAVSSRYCKVCKAAYMKGARAKERVERANDSARLARVELMLSQLLSAKTTGRRAAVAAQ